MRSQYGMGLGLMVAALLMIATPANANSLLSNQLDALDKNIEKYEKIVRQGGWPSLTSKKKLEPGATHPSVATLREILTITGDLASEDDRSFTWYKQKETPVAEQPVKDFFDSELVDALKQFQRRHGLNDDGVVGPATRAALNTPAIDRLAQLHIAKDRIDQFLVEQRGFDHGLLVNIPGFTLYSVENGEATNHMRIIVGRRDRQTHQFSKAIAYMDFNPKWYVPPKIAKKDLLPKLKKDPEFANRAGFNLTQGGEKVDATTIDWETVDQENFDFRLTQNSGRGNALGKVKFSIPDNRAIYLHDTSKPYLFKRGYRALSSGCIRVEDPLALTKFVLRQSGNEELSQAEEIYKSHRTRRITLANPVKVHSVYWTAWIEPESKQPHFYGDIYRIDRPLIAEKKRELNTLQIAAN